MTSQTVPVVIVGAGPVGLTLANLLGLQGIQTVVLERNATTVQECRAVVLDDEVLRIFADAGLIDALSAEMCMGLRVTYAEKGGYLLFEIDPKRKPLGHPLLASFLQPRLEAGLADGLKRFEHVQLKFLHTVDRISQEGDGVTVEGYDANQRRFSFRARYLVGCDGGRSTVRSMTGFKMVGSTYKERWLVLDTAGYSTGKNEISFYLDPERPSVSIPQPHGCHRWEFMLRDDEKDEEMLAPARLEALLSRFVDPRRVQIQRKVVYPFHARRAEHFRKGRILLAGDAAHLMPPFGGQGMCSGVRDAHNLSWKLTAVLQGHASEGLLDTYEAERAQHAREMTWMSIGLGQVVMARNLPVVLARGALFRALSFSPEIMEFLREFKFKPRPRIREGLLWNHLERGPWTGLMFPQPRVRTSRGEVVRLDQVMRPDFTLVGLNLDPAFALPPGELARWKRLAPRHLAIFRQSPHGPLRENEVIDVDEVFSARDGEKAAGICLLRPDRYVAAHFQLEHAPQVAEFLERALRAA